MMNPAHYYHVIAAWGTNEYHRSLLFCVVFCTLLAVYAAYDIHAAYVVEEKHVRIDVANTSFLVAEWVKSAFMSADYVLRDIISAVPTSELRYPHPDPAQHARTTQFLINKLHTLPFAVGIELANKQCITTHTWSLPPRPSIIGFNGSQREWCQLAKTQPHRDAFVTNMAIGNTQKMTVWQMRRFPGPAHELNGLAGISVELDFFSRWLEHITVAQHGTVAIADLNLKLLARKPAMPAALGKPVKDKMVAAFIASGAPYQSFINRSPLDQRQRLYGIRKVEQLPFVIVVGEANRTWQANWRQRTSGTLTALLLLWGMSILTLRHYWAVLRQRELLSQQANTDALTGIANRRHFVAQAEYELKRARRYAASTAVFLLDIDYFKQINDVHGHATGDRALIAYAESCLISMRATDILGRLGGDEFAVLLPNTSMAEACIVAERMRYTVQSCTVFNDDGAPVRMTCTIGVTVVFASDMTIDSIFAQADAALYLAKQHGRNCIAVTP